MGDVLVVRRVAPYWFEVSVGGVVVAECTPEDLPLVVSRFASELGDWGVR